MIENKDMEKGIVKNDGNVEKVETSGVFNSPDFVDIDKNNIKRKADYIDGAFEGLTKRNISNSNIVSTNLLDKKQQKDHDKINMMNNISDLKKNETSSTKLLNENNTQYNSFKEDKTNNDKLINNINKKKDIKKDMNKGIYKDSQNNMPNLVHQKESVIYPKNINDKIGDKINDETNDKICDKICDKINDKICDKINDKICDKINDKTNDNINSNMNNIKEEGSNKHNHNIHNSNDQNKNTISKSSTLHHSSQKVNKINDYFTERKNNQKTTVFVGEKMQKIKADFKYGEDVTPKVQNKTVYESQNETIIG
ncbi:hypothetical protein PFNF135_01940 [Plasmodium falciparum NF135/5.C10]|uniref:Uncharacterized protein n=1 Tax=Plasmodium falciparum NF135/5.C10 TaxID=1036726 RepID=W4IKQ3_PLAFA|nr:hypothetical protein PFNF135_01940 [Plasmodium falciparum NF135/5.C10]